MPENPTLDSPAVSSFYSAHPFYILEKNNAASFFEPVFSVHRRGILGLEALGRGIDPGNLNLIEPQDLFRDMGEEDFYLKLGLDRLFRQKGLESFAAFQREKPRLLLFLDIEPSVLEENIVGSGYLVQQIEEFRLEPRRVVVQIPLAGKWDPRQVEKFIQAQRRNHLLVCLKDIHAGPHRMRSILEFNPDLVKLDEGLVLGLARSAEKQSAVRKVVRLAHTLGIVVVAGSLENEEDALALLEIGVDLLQGSYFTKNHEKNLVLTLSRKARMAFLSARYRRRLNRLAQRDRELRKRCEQVGEYIFSCFEKEPLADLESKAPTIFRQVPALECLYRLDPKGMQVGNIALSESHIPERKRFLFEPSLPGSDHSWKEYYYSLIPGVDHALTEPYLSMNSGHFCVTAAKLIANPMGEGFQILCADLNLSKV
jgi:EAL domain-containing protein (putative c-di-GMP-specific phosphodiesterase class I)